MKHFLKSIKISTISLLFILTGCVNSEGEITPLSEGEITPLIESWEKAIPYQEIPEGLSSLSAQQCGACHQDHYKEWKTSTHAHAWTDMQFQAELKKESSPIMCINCHIPLQNQQEYIVTGYHNGDIYDPVKELNPRFDKALQQEGINCASCHVRNNAVIGPTGTNKAPHKTIKNPEFLNETLCISCHNAVAVVTPTLACTFETGDEWKAGPYFGEKNCISCHMDTLTRAVVPGYEKRLSHLHYFSGSGIPKVDTVEATMLIGLSIQPSTVKRKYAINDTVKFNLTLKNEFAGHKLPTGNPERFIIILIELKNEAGEVLKTVKNRIGEEWEWYPEAKKLSDNNLLPKEERTYSLNHICKSKENLSLQITITKHRMNDETAAYNKLTDAYPLFITIYEKSIAFSIK